MPDTPNSEQVTTFTQTLEQTGSIAAAARAVGYADTTADRGRASIAKPYRTAVELWEQAQEKIKLGQQLKKDDAENLVKGRMADVVITGKDADAVAAAKTLGGMREFDMFAQEKQVGVMMVLPVEVLDVIATRLQQRNPVVIDAAPAQLPVVPDVTKE